MKKLYEFVVHVERGGCFTKEVEVLQKDELSGFVKFESISAKKLKK